MNNYILITSLVFLVTIIGILLIIKNEKKDTNTLRFDYTECINILNDTMKREFEMKYKLEYELKDLRMLHDFQKELTNITQSTLLALSPSLMKELEFFYTRKYIISYVTRYVEIMLMSFTDIKKIKVM